MLADPGLTRLPTIVRMWIEGLGGRAVLPWRPSRAVPAGATAARPWADLRVIVPAGDFLQELCVVAKVCLDPACDHQHGDVGRSRHPQRQDGRLRAPSAYPGVIDKQHMGTLRQAGIRT